MTKLPLIALVGMAVLGGCATGTSHSPSCGAPLAGWKVPGDGWHNVLIYRVAVRSGGRITWNGAEVSHETLRTYLEIIPNMRPLPATVLSIHPNADCQTVNAVRRDMNEILNCAENRSCGEGDGEWRAGPSVDINSPLYQELLDRAERATIGAEQQLEGRNESVTDLRPSLPM